jgi:nicotinamidase-related amidase
MQEPVSKQQAADQNNVALLVIDVQQGLFSKSTYKAEQLLHNINTLIDRAHRDGVPVFFIQHSGAKTLVKGSHDWELHPQLRRLATDPIVHKEHGNAFEDTVLDAALKSGQVTNVVVTGLVTHGCVRATCIGALQLGYRVTLVKDGHSSYSKQAARLIDEWNQKLSAMSVGLKSTSEIEFS